MSQASDPALSHARQAVLANPCRPLTEIADACRRWQQDRRNRRIVAELTDAQLQDAGIDRAVLLRNKPSMEVKAGLMANLMSMQ